jgi:hypothetical protein
VEPNTITFIDALGGPAAMRQDPMSQPPYDRSRPDSLTKAQRAEFRVFDGIDDTAAVMRSVVLAQSIPVRVITAGRPWWPAADRNLVWRSAHERLAASVTDGRLIVEERSGHRVDVDQPDVIVRTVTDLVQQVRTNR